MDAYVIVNEIQNKNLFEIYFKMIYQIESKILKANLQTFSKILQFLEL